MSTEEQIELKRLVRLDKTPLQALEMLQQVYGDNTVSRKSVFKWHKRFKEDREEVKDVSGSGRHSTSRTKVDVERVMQMMCSDCRLTVQMIASQLDMKKESIWKIIIEDLSISVVNGIEYPTVHDKEEYCRTRINHLFTWCCTIWLFSFPKLKRLELGEPFWRRRSNEEGHNDWAWDIPEECIDAWQNLIKKCTRLEGDYFKGDTVFFVVWNWNNLFVIPVSLLFR